jgi:predicted membrane-bound spermidine synthase
VSDSCGKPAALVFISSACVLVIELIAGRIMAPYVGVSLYTWTSIIGIVLAGMSVGNYLGGVVTPRTTPLDEERLNAYLKSGRALTLTDDFAPVDQLLARLFIERGN